MDEYRIVARHTDGTFELDWFYGTTTELEGYIADLEEEGLIITEVQQTLC